MQEKFTLSYLPHDLEDLLNEELTIEEFLNDVLSTFKEEDDDVMVSSLLSYAQNDACGAPEVHDYEMHDIEFDVNTLTGSFSTEFVIYYYFGCDDYNKEDIDDISWDFEVDRKSEIITFIGEKTLERGPDEY